MWAKQNHIIHSEFFFIFGDRVCISSSLAEKEVHKKPANIINEMSKSTIKYSEAPMAFSTHGFWNHSDNYMIPLYIYNYIIRSDPYKKNE